MLPKREDPSQTLRIYHCLFDIAHFACCTQTDSLLPTREDMSQTSHIGRESADSALEYRGWLAVSWNGHKNITGCQTSGSRRGRKIRGRQSTDRLSVKVAWAIVSIIRQSRWQICSDGGEWGMSHKLVGKMSDGLRGPMESSDLNYPLLRALPISCCFGGDKCSNEKCWSLSTC